MSDDPSSVVAATEHWFIRHGLPYFVDGERAAARQALTGRRLVAFVVTALVLGTAVGVLVGWLVDDATNATAAGLATVAVVAAAYAAIALRAWPIATWAVARTFRSLGLLFPLVTRALPLLLLFVTFLFINTEVWQVATSLKGGILWGAVLLFAAVAIGFLLVRLPEELDKVDDEIHGQRLVASCKGTPLEDVAVDLDHDAQGTAEDIEITGYQKANLILVLLVSQIVQVLLLAFSVFLFFVVFGSVVMKRAVVKSWIGENPTQLVPGLSGLTVELMQVAVFLAAFSGLYFTVYAVTDDSYRKQFFTSIIHELERAVGVRAVYRAIKQRIA